MDARAAASKAVMDWIDADSSRDLVGCTPSMVAQIAVDAYLAEHRRAFNESVSVPAGEGRFA